MDIFDPLLYTVGWRVWVRGRCAPASAWTTKEHQNDPPLPTARQLEAQMLIAFARQTSLMPKKRCLRPRVPILNYGTLRLVAVAAGSRLASLRFRQAFLLSKDAYALRVVLP